MISGAEQVREHIAKLPTLGPIAPSKVASMSEARRAKAS
jgi:hypothetical protein